MSSVDKLNEIWAFRRELGQLVAPLADQEDYWFLTQRQFKSLFRRASWILKQIDNLHLDLSRELANERLANENREGEPITYPGDSRGLSWL